MVAITGCADLLLANSHFTSLVFETFFSIPRSLRVVYPGINISAYVPLSESDLKGQDIQEVISFVYSFLFLFYSTLKSKK